MMRLLLKASFLLFFASCLSWGGVARAQAFDFYVFALSWSPGFCAVEGQEKGREQCAVGARTGFVVHGLWPQNETASAIDCPGGQSPIPRPALEDARDLFPSEGLARYQWRKQPGLLVVGQEPLHSWTQQATAQSPVEDQANGFRDQDCEQSQPWPEDSACSNDKRTCR
jgi:hypothetical protein